MSSFERIKRYERYSSKNCKSLLRKDFSKQCAYCGSREFDVGSPKDFEIDHFVPQQGGYTGQIHPKYSQQEFDKDAYYNLYYCCSSCNGPLGKSDSWSNTLLDPCRDDIWTVHLEMLNDFIVSPKTEAGDEYIKVFKLNSASKVKNRKQVSQEMNNQYKRIEEIKKFLSVCTNPELARLLQEELIEHQNKIDYGIKYCATLSYLDDEPLSRTKFILSKYDIEELKGEYDLDYSVIKDGIKYFVNLHMHEEIVFNKDGKKNFYLSDEQVNDWQNKKVLLCHFSLKDDKVYYTSLETLDTTQKKQKYIYSINCVEYLN